MPVIHSCPWLSHVNPSVAHILPQWKPWDKMSKFKITVFTLIDVKSDDPEGRKVSVWQSSQYKTLAPTCLSPDQKREKTPPQEAYQQWWLSQLLRIYLDCPGSQHLCFNWKLDSYDFSKPYHNFHFFLVLFVIYYLSICLLISCQI